MRPILLAAALASFLVLAGVPPLAAAEPTLALSPTSGPPGTSVVAGGAGVAPGATVEILWYTMEGNRVSGSGFVEVSQSVASGTADAGGAFSISFSAPYDLGGPAHRVEAVVGGSAVAEVEFVLARDAWITPTEGPEGTLIEVRLVAGGWTQFDNNVALTWDNRFLGFACSFNSQGNITVWVQAVGGVGPHVLGVYPALYWGPSDGPTPWKHPVLNVEDLPTEYAIEEFTFRVTEGTGVSGSVARDLEAVTAPDSLAIPSLPAVPVEDGTPRLTVGNGGKAVAGGDFPYALAGFPANAQVDLRWSTVTTETTTGGTLGDKFLGWVGTPVSQTLATVTVDATGKASGTLETPMDFGGVHLVEALVDGVVLTTADWWIIPRFTADLHDEGRRIELHATGLGWEKYTAVWDVLYDGSLSGFVSAFTGQGSVAISLPVVGAPGLHTIEIHEGSNAWPYLNMHESPWPWEPVYRFSFTIEEPAVAAGEPVVSASVLGLAIVVSAVLGFAASAALRRRKGTRDESESAEAPEEAD